MVTKPPQAILGTEDDKRVLRDLRDFIDTLERLIAVSNAGVTRMRMTTKEGSAELVTRRP